MIEVLNEFHHATFRGDGIGTRVTLELPVGRKLRRAMRSRRWEKKICKALSKALGYQILNISRRKATT